VPAPARTAGGVGDAERQHGEPPLGAEPNRDVLAERFGLGVPAVVIEEQDPSCGALRDARVAPAGDTRVLGQPPSSLRAADRPESAPLPTTTRSAPDARSGAVESTARRSSSGRLPIVKITTDSFNATASRP
jgi:hypothetical protein